MMEKTMEQLNEEIIFKIISFSGDARSYIYTAFEMVARGEYEKAEEVLNKANESINCAHNVQTNLIQKEAQGIHTDISLLMVHAQDQLMTTLLAKDMVQNMIFMQKEINDLKKKLIHEKNIDK